MQKVREGTLAALSMLRGFLNAIEPLEETDSQVLYFSYSDLVSVRTLMQECAALAMCEATSEAARRGEVGQFRFLS